MNTLLKKLPLRRTCQEVSVLVIAQEDRQLPWIELLALRIHMGICRACPLFQRQVLTMRNAMKQWRHYGAGDDSEH